jgi:hypothetical protein
MSREFDKAEDNIRSSTNDHAPVTISARELMAKALPSVKWIVPGILPEGVTILAGKPKLGKSWLAFGLALAVASGGMALGKRYVECGECLYLALEDNERRLRTRLSKLLNDSDPPEGLHITTWWQTMDQGGAATLDEWLSDHPRCRLVIVDVLQYVRPYTSPSQSVYASDYRALQALRDIASKHGVAVLVIHHLRKAIADDPLDEISGSTGLSGAADGMLLLKRKRNQDTAYLLVDGRDIEEPAEYALTWDRYHCSWRLAGDAEEFSMGSERAEVCRVLEEAPEGMTPTEITDSLNERINSADEQRTVSSTKKLVWTMSRDGQINNDSGRYYPVTRNSGNPVTGTHATVTQSSSHSNPSSDDPGAQYGNGADTAPSYPVTGVTSYSGDNDTLTVESGRRLTLDEVAHVQRLTQDGMDPALARHEVLESARQG